MREKNNRRGLGNAVLLFTSAIWGFAFVFQRDAMTSGIGPYSFSAMRMLLAAVCVWAFVIVSERISGRRKDFGEAKDEAAYRRNTLRGGLLVGTAFAAASILQQVGILYTTAGKAGFETALYIVLVPVLSALFLRKRYALLTWGGVGLGIVGIYLLSVTEGFSIGFGDLIIIMSAFLFAVQILLIDRFIGKADGIRIAAIELTVSAAVSFVLMLLFEQPTAEIVRSSLVSIAYCGIMSGGVGYTLQIIGQKMTEPTVASLLMSFESVFAALGGALFLREFMSFKEILGCIILFAAVITVQLPGPSAAGSGKGA